MANNSQSNQVGVYVPTTEVWDVAQLYQVDITSPEFKELLVRMYQNLNRMALALNVSTKGYYDVQGEFVDGNLWFPKPGLTSATSPAQRPAFRQEERTVLNLPQIAGIALPAAATTAINHNITITTNTTFTALYGVASDQTGFNYYPLNYAGATTISMFANATQVSITNNTAINFSVCYVVLEYLQI